jgi:hypothetical protein
MKHLYVSAVACILCACSDVTAPNTPSGPAVSAPATLQPPTSARDARIQDTWAPAALTTVNPCNADVIALTGVSHTTVDQSVKKNNTIVKTKIITYYYTGVGVPSGARYWGTDSYVDESSTGTPFPLEDNLTTELELESNQESAEFSTYSNLHIKFDQNGNLTLNRSIFKTHCESDEHHGH